MSQYEIYTLFLCLIVFVAFTAVFTVMITLIVKSTVKLIRMGAEDEKIKTEYKKATKNSCVWGAIEKAVSVLFCAVLLFFFLFSLYVNFSQEAISGDIPVLRVVNSGSMAQKHEKNEYLVENDLNDQIMTFDLIVTHALPAEDELKLYDIVVYEVDGMLLVHRIVGIEEPNADHPEEYYFLLQGDNVERPDRFPVRYSQMKAIYRGQRVPFIGSFVSFLQSPAGWLCILLMIFAIVAAPMLESKIEKEKAIRYKRITRKQNTVKQPLPTPMPVFQPVYYMQNKPYKLVDPVVVEYNSNGNPMMVIQTPTRKTVIDERGAIVSVNATENKR